MHRGWSQIVVRDGLARSRLLLVAGGLGSVGNRLRPACCGDYEEEEDKSDSHAASLAFHENCAIDQRYATLVPFRLGKDPGL
jgi:hypothetical protein